MRSRWGTNIPKCTVGKNHKWKGSIESGRCLKCGYDAFDLCYKKVEES